MHSTEKNAPRANNSSRRSTHTGRNTVPTLFKDGLGTPEQAYLFILSLRLLDEFKSFCEHIPQAKVGTCTLSILLGEVVRKQISREASVRKAASRKAQITRSVNKFNNQSNK